MLTAYRSHGVTAADVPGRIRGLRVIPVLVIEEPAHATAVAGALIAGGLPCAEVTFRTRGASEALRRMSDAYPDLLLGAGTVLTPAQVDQASAAGAHFIVAPGFNPAVVDACLERALPVFPGVCTPTEIEAAMGKGLRVLKFFPAEAAGGTAMLKALSAPYGEVEFIPTGGINRANLHNYLSLPGVFACGGSWMATADWIAAGQFDRIRDETAETMRGVREREHAA